MTFWQYLNKPFLVACKFTSQDNWDSEFCSSFENYLSRKETSTNTKETNWVRKYYLALSITALSVLRRQWLFENQSKRIIIKTKTKMAERSTQKLGRIWSIQRFLNYSIIISWQIMFKDNIIFLLSDQARLISILLNGCIYNGTEMTRFPFPSFTSNRKLQFEVSG